MEPLWRSRTRSILPGCIRTYSNRMVCLLPFLFTAILNAQPAVQWTKTFGSSLMEVGYSILETDDGGFVMAGVKTSSGDSQEDFWLLKGDANGNLLWDRTFGGTGREYAYSVATRPVADTPSPDSPIPGCGAEICGGGNRRERQRDMVRNRGLTAMMKSVIAQHRWGS